MRHRLLGRQPPALLQFAQVSPVNKFHQQVVHRTGLAVFIDGHDIGMAQARQSPRLAIEPLGKAGIGRHLSAEEFSRPQLGPTPVAAPCKPPPSRLCREG